MRTFARKALFIAATLGLCATHASAQTYDFTTCGATGAAGPDQAACDTAYSGGTLDGTVTVAAGIQSWTVPATGSYRITAVGAQGIAGNPSYQGGAGAQMLAEFDLTAGTTLQFVVGQQGIADNPGDSENGGGGGGSFVVTAADSPQLVGGGGGGTRAAASQNGCDASITAFGITGSGSSSTSACTVKVADEGLGGIISSSSYGSAGAGFNGDGASDSTYGAGGLSWANGMMGGNASAAGGFGGGGSGNGSWGGGGGGGYSGGDGGFIGGGGGSYADAAATNVAATAAVGLGDGTITVTALVVAAGAPTQPEAVPVMSAYGVGVTILALLALATRRLSRRKPC